MRYGAVILCGTRQPVIEVLEKQLAAVPFLDGAGEAADRTVGEPDQAFGRGEGRLVELAPLMRRSRLWL